MSRLLAASTLMDAPFSYRVRASSLEAMTAEPADLLVIGGGVTGAGIARDATMRGFRTVLVDKGDFGSGTSSRSSRLVHGGLRYLEHHHWRLVFEASRERSILLNIAPHLVWPRSFIFPVHEVSRLPRWKLAAGLWLYDLLSLFQNVRRHRMLSKRAILRAEPGLRSRGLRGGARYFDAQCDDARLALANARDAHRHGALVANYTCVDRLESADGRVRGAHVTDLVTGATLTVRALVVVNATGPWSDELRAAEGESPTLRTTKGVHIVVPRQRIGNREALTILSPIDGRVMFIVPWGNLSYIGTTETETVESPDDVVAHASDVIYLLRSANALFPEARLAPEDVLATWAGLRPLLRKHDAQDPGAVSREHTILQSSTGLISILGGKLTTYRHMAAQVVDVVAKRLHALDGRPVPRRAPTDREPLPGGETRDLRVLIEATEGEGFPPPVARHLVHTYGSEAPAVTRLAQSDPTLAEPVVPDHPTLRAELIHAMHREMAITLGDLFIRRTHLFYAAPERVLALAPAIADMAAREMEWDETRRSAELAAYRDEVERSIAFRSELPMEPA
ncbi:MAG: FAD-dependent oxidoreductase [Gemmatimonadales bacterium]|nr:FAD-dependent oxidoreductase [Gemmatimonadales bacterium]NIN10396.1 FAD-dependent oxidoreductase [Gemmatimonadales bacterium]NIN49188.1 FAD-dependent oxidoreductase [Gemmatimonadales bacterium]NIP06652.1 FAD-dependent oxidoreductase [Gemmatimonadales bacterium]NIQ99982.1 FAD-dependent oxidoreductase [Gemmatimonadales bacterium]